MTGAPTSKSRAASDLVALERQLERNACVEALRDKAIEATSMAAKGKASASEASMLSRRLNAVADEIEQGMHR